MHETFIKNQLKINKNIKIYKIKLRTDINADKNI